MQGVINILEVAAIILVKNNKVLIAQRVKGDPLEGKWEFPGGKIEANETPEECIKREMQEEFMVEVIVGEFFAESKYCYKHADIHLRAYLGRIYGGSPIPLSHSGFCWVRLNELNKYDFASADQPIVDSLLNAGVVK